VLFLAVFYVPYSLDWQPSHHMRGQSTNRQAGRSEFEFRGRVLSFNLLLPPDFCLLQINYTSKLL
jgi:hypothetical protein